MSGGPAKKVAAILIVAVTGALAALWTGYKSPLGVKVGRWYLAATPVEVIEQEVRYSRDRVKPLDLHLVFVDNATMARKSPEICGLYDQILDSLTRDGRRLVDPSGCIRTYSRGDSAAVTLEYYLDCDCAMSTSMDVIYLSVDLRNSPIAIRDDVLRSGVPRIGFPDIDPVRIRGG